MIPFTIFLRKKELSSVGGNKCDHPPGETVLNYRFVVIYYLHKNFWTLTDFLHSLSNMKKLL
jgi:hypothetical protein